MTVREVMDEIGHARRTAELLDKWSLELDEHQENMARNAALMLTRCAALLEEMEVKTK